MTYNNENIKLINCGPQKCSNLPMHLINKKKMVGHIPHFHPCHVKLLPTQNQPILGCNPYPKGYFPV
jgi:hypothetical protein